MKKMSLASMLNYDYAVVGAGINGTFTAYHLARRGFKTVLIDQVNKGLQVFTCS